MPALPFAIIFLSQSKVIRVSLDQIQCWCSSSIDALMKRSELVMFPRKLLVSGQAVKAKRLHNAHRRKASRD